MLPQQLQPLLQTCSEFDSLQIELEGMQIANVKGDCLAQFGRAGRDILAPAGNTTGSRGARGAVGERARVLRRGAQFGTRSPITHA